jgi:flagellin
MPTSISSGARIRTNTPAENAYNALFKATQDIASKQLRLSTGKRINTAADDVAGYVTARSLSSRNGALNTALKAAGEAINITSVVQDAYDNVNGLLTQIKDAAAQASSGALGTDEKVALAKAAYRLAEQIQLVTDSTVFGGKQLIAGGFTGSWVVGYTQSNSLLNLSIDLSTGNVSTFNVTNAAEFNINATTGSGVANFGGVTSLNLADLNAVSDTNLGIFSTDNISATLTSLASALNNVNKVASYVGGIQARIGSQEDLLRSQITNYNAAISRIQDADVAEEQMGLVRAQFLQQASLVSLAQANQNPSAFLQLLR